mmetsp:Transcript_45421/g.128164  ORF Transcript_45421/g.128164 Transcript_45421/m.128164 type:complete len:85 (+) Transcript_45421:799-1053(+)
MWVGIALPLDHPSGHSHQPVIASEIAMPCARERKQPRRGTSRLQLPTEWSLHMKSISMTCSVCGGWGAWLKSGWWVGRGGTALL